ncbi:MAG TPA: phosphoribosylformylglycinamidine synthase subunit PurL [Planctomycetota bacterium]|nr:phosphoribosylformylglycinamidine synthase subunit PurL [Planctomycetota bacterium]
MPLSAFCIEVALREDRQDVVAARVAAQARELGLPLPDGLRSRRGWSLRVRGGEREARRLAEGLLVDPVMHVVRVLSPDADPREHGSRRLEIVRLPGVMDPGAQSIVRAATRLELDVQDVRSWQAFVAPAGTDPAALKRLGNELLANAAIEEVRLDPTTGIPPVADLPETPFRLVHVAIQRAGAAELERLSRDGCLALDATEMRAVQEHFRAEDREPTDIELETIAQTWSEHCKHKTLTGLVEYEGRVHDNLLKSTIARATRELDRPFCKSVFVDNAGVVAFDEKHHLTFKVETHNHPSAIEPYGGAGTGLGGVLRDTLGTGLGARPIASTDVFCFGPADLPAGKLPRGALHPRRVMKGVVAGVRDYGNRMGIPTVNGAVCFDERYTGNPLVYCGSIGLLPADRLHKEVRPGDLVLLAGGRTGRDGIHGATFSSQELHEESEKVSSGAVQIGNAIEEKRLMDALLQARDLGLYRAVTDCGAGGLSSAVGEMAADTGAQVQLERVPLKYHGLSYAEIWISEAQERMVFAVPPEHEAAILRVFAAEDVEATVIGRFEASGRLRADFRGTRVMDLDLRFLHEGLPRRTRQAVRRARATRDPAPLPAGREGEMLRRLLGAPNIASKAWIIHQYDHEVQAGSVVKPLVGPRREGPSDAAVVAPVLGSRRGFAVGCGLDPCLGDVDPGRMALHAIDEALRNVVAVGGDPAQASILDNFSWGSCERPENLGDLVEACLACYAGAKAYGTPFISGKDSLNNDYRVGDAVQSIPPTLLISALAIVPDVAQACSMDLKGAGHELVLVGESGPELGGSHLARLLGEAGAEVPPVDLARAPRILSAVHAAIARGLVLACHDLSEGGLGVAAAEMAFGGGVGAELDLARLPVRGAPDVARRLFGQSASRFLLEVEPAQIPALHALLADLPHARLGRTAAHADLVVTDGGRPVLREPLAGLRAAWLAPLDLDHEHGEAAR